MPSNYTSNYQLNQWEADDRVLRTDFNADNTKIDAELAELRKKADMALYYVGQLGLRAKRSHGALARPPRQGFLFDGFDIAMGPTLSGDVTVQNSTLIVPAGKTGVWTCSFIPNVYKWTHGWFWITNTYGGTVKPTLEGVTLGKPTSFNVDAPDLSRESAYQYTYPFSSTSGEPMSPYSFKFRLDLAAGANRDLIVYDFCMVFL